MEQQPVQYVTADGQPVQYVMEQPGQYVMEQQPVQYVTADGQPVSYVDPSAVYEYAAPAVQYVQQPSVFNVSPETFAKLMQGGSLTPEEIAGISGAPAPASVAPAPAPVEAVAEAVTAVPAAVTAVPAAVTSETAKPV